MGTEGLYRTMYLAQSSWYAESPEQLPAGEADESGMEPTSAGPGTAWRS